MAERAVADATKALLVVQESPGPRERDGACELEHLFVRELLLADELAVALQAALDGAQAGAAFDALVAGLGAIVTPAGAFERRPQPRPAA
jgi:hypothetical protein